MSQFKLVKDLELEESIEISSDYTELNNAISCLSDQLSELCAISLLKPNGGSISGDIEIHNANFTVLSGSYIQTTDPKNIIFDERNSFLQAEAAHSSSGKTYGHSYCGTMGYCITSVCIKVEDEISSFGFKLSGDITTLSDAFYNNIYLGKNISTDYGEISADPLFSGYSRAIKGQTDESLKVAIGKDKYHYIMGNYKQLSTLAYSFSMYEDYYPTFSTIKEIDENDVVWFTYTLNQLSNLTGNTKKFHKYIQLLSQKDSAYFIDRYENDDNAFYAIGFPYIGNLNIKNIYGSTAAGGSSRAIGKYSHAEGRDTIADARYAHAEGAHTKALGMASHAEGFDTTASGKFSKSSGWCSSADGTCSFVHGECARSHGDYSVTFGQQAYNYSDQSFVWNGTKNEYKCNETGAFKINPKNGISNVYIGNDNFITCVLKAIQQMTPEQKTLLKTAIGI